MCLLISRTFTCHFNLVSLFLYAGSMGPVVLRCFLLWLFLPFLVRFVFVPLLVVHTVVLHMLRFPCLSVPLAVALSPYLSTSFALCPIILPIFSPLSPLPRSELQALPDLQRTKLCKVLITTGSCDNPDCRPAGVDDVGRAAVEACSTGLQAHSYFST